MRSDLIPVGSAMDVSIAVTLIRGQMGTVVERAVNGAVETVLAEMLKVVGSKFEELKAELLLAKHSAAALQREKALKEKENDNIRARLRYTELKLKYYRQGVEEELQQRAAAVFRSPPDRDTSQRKDVDQQNQINWSNAPLSRPDGPDATEDLPQGLVDEVMPPPTSSQHRHACDQVKLEALSDQEELVSIKEEEEEPEEEEEEQETCRLSSHWTKLTNQTSRAVNFSPADHNSHPQLPAPSSVAPPPAGPMLTWTNEVSLYEEYKLHRNELRRRNLNRRKELEKALPQPLLADLIRERREKTRLRVARWRAKRKLQAQGGAAALGHSGSSVDGQQLRTCGLSSASSAAPPTNLFLNSSVASIFNFLPHSSSSSLQGSSVAPPPHGITSCFLQSSQSQRSAAHSQE